MPAKAVQNDRKISDKVWAGGVAAAIESESGRIYVGVCVDTCSTLGIEVFFVALRKGTKYEIYQ